MHNEREVTAQGKVVDKQAISHFLVKDGFGEYISVFADEVETGGNGLRFYVDNSLRACFVQWCHYREVREAGR